MKEKEPKPRSSSSSLYLGIFFISLATLNLEISLTRLFSVAQGYHFAFMVVSIALLGLGASGSFLMLFPSLLKKGFPRILTFPSLLFSLSSFFSYLITNNIPFDPARLSWDLNQPLYFLLYYFFLSLPFFFTGLTISLAIARLPHRVNYLYFSDLSGASLGSLLVLFSFSLSGAEGAVIISVLLGLLSSLFFSLSDGRKVRIFLFSLIPLFSLLLWLNPSFMQIRLSPYKGLAAALRYPGAKLLDTRWNFFSRVDLLESPAVRFAPGLSLRYLEPLPYQLGLAIDGDNLNAITRYQKREDLKFTAYLPSALPYYLRERREVLILEPSGGLEVLSALYHQARFIEGIELNPLIIEAIKKDYGEFAGRIYQNQRVKITLGGARNFLARTSKHYDLIQIPIADALGAASTGIYGLNENYLFTEEAFQDYYAHLNPQGVLSISTYLLPPPRQELRLISLSLSALEKMGISHPEEHLMVIRSWGTITILLKKGKVEKEEIANLKKFSSSRRFDLVYYPGIKAEEVNIYNRFKEPFYYQLTLKLLKKEERERLYQDYLFNLRPVRDDRPFFYQFFKWGRLKELYFSVGEKWQLFLEGGFLLPLILLQALVLSMVLIILPLFFLKKEGGRVSSPEEKRGKGRWLFYFFLIGMGFMFIEISLIQRFILFLDHPVYAISLIIFTLLLSSGLGSYFSGRGKGFRENGVLGTIFLLAGLIFLYFFLLPKIFSIFLGKSLFIRQFLTFFLLFPLGFLMGIPFPSGIRLLSQSFPRIIPWAWGVNGCSSVLASVLVGIVALEGGFSLALILAALGYLGAGGLLISSRPPQP